MPFADRVSLIVLIFASGCHAWQPVLVPGPDQPIAGTPNTLRITRRTNCGATPSADCAPAKAIVVLYSPRVQGDSLIGYYDRANRERVAIPVRDVLGIESREIDPYKTTGMAIGIGLVIAAVAVATFAILLSSIDY
jgi:hypothetical protein